MSAPEIELDKMDLRELKKLRREVDDAINGYAQRQMRIALQEIEAVAKKHGLTLNDISNARKFATRFRKPRRVTARYRNPNDPSKIWTGLGRKPAWFAEAIESGISKEDMLIKD